MIPVRLVPAALAAAALLAAPALAQEDPGLDQVISSGEAVATGPAVLELGHVDVGPRLIEGRWQLLARDDGVVPSVWRDLDDVVLRIADTALRSAPEDPRYGFLGVEPGQPVHVVPQIQAPDVVWLGWNTQDPDVMAAIDRGVTLTLRGVDGPGQLTVYLQSGNLTEPEVLWRSERPEAQPLWVDVNAHTHANWVFSAPGVYLVAVEASADLVTGETVTDTQVLRFAVGDGTSTDAARTAAFAGPLAPEPVPDGEADEDRSGRDDRPGPPVAALLGGGAVLLLAVVGVAVAGGRARRRALADRCGKGA